MRLKGILRKIRNSVLVFGLFIVGCLLGVVLFAPWNVVWEQALFKLDSQIKDIKLEWDAVDEADINSLKLKGLRVIHPQGEGYVQDIDLNLGLSPLVKARIDTGNIFNLKINFNKSLEIEGGINVDNLLPDYSFAGIISLEGKLYWEQWTAPPNGGYLNVSTEKILVSPKMRLTQFQADSRLNENKLDIDKLSLAEPVEFSGSGQLSLNWKNMPKSKYEFKGKLNLGQGETSIAQDGRIGNVMNLL